MLKESVDWLNGIVWSDALVYLCLGAGLYFSVATRFLQVTQIRHMWQLLRSGKDSTRGLSSFQAFALAASGRVGTGNIAGVATAIAMGGPGAVFWMWVIAFLGAASAFVESTLAQMYNEELDGELRGGPAYYIEKGMRVKWYAVLFAVSALLATGFFLPGVQSNSIASAMANAFGLSPTVTAIAVASCLGLIVLGGLHRIGHAAQYIVPVMAVGYMLVALLVVAVNIGRLPETVMLIFKSALGLEQAFAGIFGAALAWGIKRGIYSNEAGQGTGPIAAATADVSHPAKQGLVQAFSVYFDTWLVCTATALMILITDSYNVAAAGGGFIVEHLPGIEKGPAFTQAAVNTVLPGFGPGFVAISLLLFAFTTLLAYYYYAESNVAYLFHQGSKRRLVAIGVTKVTFIGSVFYGAFHSAALAWTLGDLGVGLMAWINIFAIIMLKGKALDCWRDYQRQRQDGRDPVWQRRGDLAREPASIQGSNP